MILTINSDFYPHAAFISMVLYWKNTVFSVMYELRCKFILVIIRSFSVSQQSVVHPKKQTRISVQITSLLFFFCIKSAAHVGQTVARVCVFERRAASCFSLCIRKVLQLPSRSRFALIFLGPRTNSALVTSVRIELHTSRGSLPTATFCPNTALPAVSKFCHNEPSKYKIQQNSKPGLNARILFFYSIIKQSIFHHPVFFTSQHFTLPAYTFTRWTSGHSLAIFVAVHSVPPDHQHHASHCNPSFSFVFCITRKKDN